MSSTREKSEVWLYFSPHQNYKTKCDICKNEFSYHGSTSTLKYHLIHRHKIIDVLIRRGNAYRETHQYENSIIDFNKALKFKHDHIDALIGRGKTYDMKDKYEEAYADFNKVLEIEPDQEHALSKKKEIERKMAKSHKKSIKYFKTTLDNCPNNYPNDYIINLEKVVNSIPQRIETQRRANKVLDNYRKKNFTYII
ncbi:hypothetical protein Glove_408g18 [Diversispora epigaea]|uniref:BED-type domain-containing protein n=1 Tax=Diversispora epigaea TaxID=1348612 RepID=A0A397GYA6_9GLOM|nr:hypothetical protein Glove_408g18 [Diversispora epigaea]